MAPEGVLAMAPEGVLAEAPEGVLAEAPVGGLAEAPEGVRATEPAIVRLKIFFKNIKTIFKMNLEEPEKPKQITYTKHKSTKNPSENKQKRLSLSIFMQALSQQGAGAISAPQHQPGNLRETRNIVK